MRTILAIILCSVLFKTEANELAELEQRLTERLDLILEERQELHHRLSEAESKLTEAVDKLSVAEEKILRLGDPPAAYHCAFQDSWGGSNSGQITYDNVFYSTTSGDLTTGIDQDTGDYTAGWGGTYQISWSMQNMDHDNENVQGLELRKNGESIPEVYFDTHWNDNSITYSAYIYEMTGRTVFLRLDVGDTLALRCTKDCRHMHFVNFCVKLDKPDYPGP